MVYQSNFQLAVFTHRQLYPCKYKWAWFSSPNSCMMDLLLYQSHSPSTKKAYCVTRRPWHNSSVQAGVHDLNCAPTHKYRLYGTLKGFQGKWVTRIWFKTRYCKASLVRYLYVQYGAVGETRAINSLCLVPRCWPYSRADCSFHMVTDSYSVHLRDSLELLLTDHTGGGAPPWLGGVISFSIAVAEEGTGACPSSAVRSRSHAVLVRSCSLLELRYRGRTMLFQGYRVFVRVAVNSLTNQTNPRLAAFFNSGNTCRKTNVPYVSLYEDSPFPVSQPSCLTYFHSNLSDWSYS